jgi:hypothetical protein
MPEENLDPRTKLAMLGKRIGREEIQELEVVCRSAHYTMNEAAQAVLPESGEALGRDIELGQEYWLLE